MGSSFDSGLTKLSAGANPMVNRPHMYSRLRSIAGDGCPSLLIPAPAICQQPLIPVMTLVSCWIISPQAVMSSSFWMNPFFLMTLWVCVVLIWRSSFEVWGGEAPALSWAGVRSSRTSLIYICQGLAGFERKKELGKAVIKESLGLGTGS